MARPILLAAAIAAFVTLSAPAETRPLAMSEHEEQAPVVPPILSARERAETENRILAERLDVIVPAIMREQGVDLWLLVAREYFEDPVVASMLDAKSMHARRRTILIFHDPGGGKPVERITVSRYGLGGLFAPAWDPARQPDQWQAVADIIAARNPAKIAINTSDLYQFADGMTHSQYNRFVAALPATLRGRIVSGETLSIRWLETRTPAEIELYPTVLRAAHAVIAEAFSRRVITPGVTTAEQVQWWYRDRLLKLGLDPWFHPSVGIQRQGASGMLDGAEVIRPGDLLWTDFGITYLRLNTDTQHLAYVLKPGETEAPAGLRRGLANSNRVQDILARQFVVGRSGNEALALARAEALSAGLDPSIYSHPIGLHGHGAGPSIGFWDNQNADPRGEGPINANTAWSIELTSYAAVPEWGGQRVDFRAEENAFFDGKTLRYIDGRQTELQLIPSGNLPEPSRSAFDDPAVAALGDGDRHGAALRREIMDFELPEEYRMLQDLVRRFVNDQLMPFEARAMEQEATGQSPSLTAEELAKVNEAAKAMGIVGLDAPEDVGGLDLPNVAMVGVNEELGRTIVPYYLPPDSPNLRMMMATVNEQQREAYLAPYVRGETISAIGISEPGAGSDPAGMTTRAVRDGDDWVLNGRKIWISRAAEADFTIVMAVTGESDKGRKAMSAFIVDRDAPGFSVTRKIAMLGGQTTYEIALEDCRVAGWKLLGQEGNGFAPMQVRLGTRRLQMAAWSVGAAQRALDMLIDFAPQRSTFGKPLSERQTIQNWVADAATKIHAARLMTYHCAWKLDRQLDARQEISMIKAYATEMAYEVIDRTMQAFGGMGMTRELPLAMLQAKVRTMRIYDGPTEIHNWVIARNLLGTRA